MKYVISFACLATLLGCASQKPISKCPNTNPHEFTQILNEKFLLIVENDTISNSEIRFQCASSAFNTSKAMYDAYGIWSKEIIDPSSHHTTILVWENVDLYSNNKKYTVLTYGEEKYGEIYSSVMVFDDKQNDLLVDSSNQKIALKNFFTNLIKNNDKTESSFIEVYWKRVDKEVLENIRKYRNGTSRTDTVYRNEYKRRFYERNKKRYRGY